MNNFFELNEKQKKVVITQVAAKIGLPVQAVEKDLWVTVILQILFKLPFAKEAIENDELWEAILHHRKIFTSVKGVDYTSNIREKICLVPPLVIKSEWKKDYLAMQSTMIYGTSLSFEDLIERIQKLENSFRNRN